MSPCRINVFIQTSNSPNTCHGSQVEAFIIWKENGSEKCLSPLLKLWERVATITPTWLVVLTREGEVMKLKKMSVLFVFTSSFSSLDPSFLYHKRLIVSKSFNIWVSILVNGGSNYYTESWLVDWWTEFSPDEWWPDFLLSWQN